MPEFAPGGFGARWIADIVGIATEWMHETLTSGYESLGSELFGTPVPETNGHFVLGTPTNEPWLTIHEAVVGGEITLVALLILVSVVQAQHFFRVFNLGDAILARQAKSTAWIGAMFIVCWYWIATLSLYLVDGFTLALLPSFEAVEVVMVGFLTTSVTNPVLAFLFAGVGGLTMTALKILLYLREILLYIYVYAMPLALALKYGNLAILSRIADGIVYRFVPLALFPLPVAIIFHAYGLLFTDEFGLSLLPGTALVSNLIAISLPIVCVYVTWKLFGDAAPRTARAMKRTGSLVTTGVAALGFGYAAGPSAALNAARYGKRAAAAQTVIQRFGEPSNGRVQASPANSRADGTAQDNVATDALGQHGVPSYRRTENDPGYQ